VTDTTDVATNATGGSGATTKRPRTQGTVAELQAVAAGLGITGTAKMRKGDLIAAIESNQAGSGRSGRSRSASNGGESAEAPRESTAKADGAARTERTTHFFSHCAISSTVGSFTWVPPLPPLRSQEERASTLSDAMQRVDKICFIAG
jgi:hypothetical protein